MSVSYSVGIDGYNLALPHGTGVATYGRSLAGTLQRGGHRIEGVFGLDAGRDTGLRETVFFDTLGHPRPLNRAQRRSADRAQWLHAMNPLLSAKAVEVPISGRVDIQPLAERVPSFDRLVTTPDLFDLAMRHFGIYGRFLPLKMKQPPQVMHWTYPVPVKLVGARNVYTLHDIVPLRLPFTTLDVKARYRSILARCMAEAAAICTVSETSRNDILGEFGAGSAPVHNLWQASPMAGIPDAPEDDATAVRGIFGLADKGYFLFLGAIEPKKNVGRLIEAYLSLDTATPLVIVGGKGWQSDQELILLPKGEAGSEILLGGRVRMLSHLPRSLLLKLIRSARAVLFPSLSEGFGLPVLEAMQLATPVLTSRISSLPEVAGDAALLIDPYDVRAIAGGLAALDRDDALRARLAAAGPRQAEKFSEARFLGRLEAFYASVLAGTGSRPDTRPDGDCA